MEYQKIIPLDDTMNQNSKIRITNWVEIYNELGRKYNNSNIKFKMSMIRSNLCNYRDEYIFAKGTLTVPNTETSGAAVNNTNKNVIFKNCAPFTNCVTKINNTQVDDAQNTHVVMPMYNLIEYSDAYLKTSGGLWQ